MTKTLTGNPGRYETPDIRMFGLGADGILCQSGGDATVPEGYTWEDWATD